MASIKLVSNVNKFNIYKWLVEKLGKEEKEQFIPSPFGGTSIREWKNGKVVLARRVSVSFVGSEMVDELVVSEEFEDLIKEIEGKVERIERN